jgi:hypothetical protein
MMVKRIKVLETMLVLALASLVCHWIWEVTWLIWFAAGLLALALMPNPLVNFIASFWLNLSEYIGSVMSKSILSLVFFLLLTPLAILYRLFNQGMTRYCFDRASASTFDSTKELSRESFEKPW